MSLEQQARWYHLLVYVSCHGENGRAVIPAPARLLVHALHLSDFDSMVVQIGQMVNISIEEKSNAEITVAFPKWNKYQVDSTVTERSRRFRQGTATPKEKDKDKEKEKEEVFGSSFWPAYPRKESKLPAQKAWMSISPDLYGTIISALERHKQSAQWKKDNGQYIPLPATWLNQKRWEDELAPSASSHGKVDSSKW